MSGFVKPTLGFQRWTITDNLRQGWLYYWLDKWVLWKTDGGQLYISEGGKELNLGWVKIWVKFITKSFEFKLLVKTWIENYRHFYCYVFMLE